MQSILVKQGSSTQRKVCKPSFATHGACHRRCQYAASFQQMVARFHSRVAPYGSRRALSSYPGVVREGEFSLAPLSPAGAPHHPPNALEGVTLLLEVLLARLGKYVCSRVRFAPSLGGSRLYRSSNYYQVITAQEDAFPHRNASGSSCLLQSC